ncbi:hypothetical protein AVEN_259828-1 [Araneus ventricosus]|uniref:Uncharacterized protein n=1 Tax=Araneus ventricosus TaxID=182803 RepID=A0A4Y2I4N3_ARAVE|nr:hypothetical protein AVEN_259828-1 [Araneus ventricosus]
MIGPALIFSVPVNPCLKIAELGPEGKIPFLVLPRAKKGTENYCLGGREQSKFSKQGGRVTTQMGAHSLPFAHNMVLFVTGRGGRSEAFHIPLQLETNGL